MKTTSHPDRNICACSRRTATGSVGFSVVQKSGVARMRSQTARRRRSLSCLLTDGSVALSGVCSFSSSGALGVGSVVSAPNRSHSRPRTAERKPPTTPPCRNRRVASSVSTSRRSSGESVERRGRCCPGGRNDAQDAVARRGDRFRFVTVVTPPGRGGRPVQGNRTDYGEKRRVGRHL